MQIFNCVNLLVGGVYQEFESPVVPLLNRRLKGAAVFSSITGMNPIATCFLLPIGVVIYTITGGSKSLSTGFSEKLSSNVIQSRRLSLCESCPQYGPDYEFTS